MSTKLSIKTSFRRLKQSYIYIPFMHTGKLVPANCLDTV